MLSLFVTQSLRARRGDYGQASVLLLCTVAAILSLVFGVIHVAHLGAEKVASANSVDAIALSAATWEARALNMIAALNDGIEQCFRLIRWTCVLWAAMAIAAATGLGVSAFLEYSKKAGRTIRSAWETARRFSAWERKIRDAVPYLILAETGRLAAQLEVAGALFPYDPRGPPIHQAKRKIARWKWARKVAKSIFGIIDSVLRSAIGSDPAPIFMLVPEDHIASRQRVRFAGSRSASAIPVPFFPSNPPVRFLTESAAEAYGGTATSMTWKSRFTEWTREK
jgi:hypothetical protein